MSTALRDLREQPFELLQQLETALRAARTDIVGDQTQTWTGLGFRLDGHWLVAPKDDVREVIPPPKTTRVPNAKSWLTGLANVRGELLTLVDLRQFLGAAQQEEASRTQRVIVFNGERGAAGFLVDEVLGYRQFTPSEQRREVMAGAGSLEPYLLGGFVREGQPWLAFSFRKLAASDAYKQAGA